ncbi:MAG: glutamate mutase L [Chloroflexi bacterium]|nr:glutamate mutase L [Chloroflexota bacterium]
MPLTILVDFGSTYTKLTAVDLATGELIARVQSPTTVETDITIGLDRARAELTRVLGHPPATDRILACSSAAGGLRLVAVGLVPELTAEAAKRAALGAGAKVLDVFSYQLSPAERRRLEATAPDLVLLAGGTDGGNKDVILHNARILAESTVTAPIVVGGNKVVAEECGEILAQAGKVVRVTENVMPELGKLNVDPARAAIRDVFIERIVHAKGLDKAQEIVGDILMPTPMAVLDGARLLARGTPDEPGLGDLLLVDVGGATTDVHSVAAGHPTTPGVQQKGLPEPEAKRTVEGDLGIRYNAPHIVELAGEARVRRAIAAALGEIAVGDLISRAGYLSQHVETVPETAEDIAVDVGLARTAVEIAVERHAGVLEQYYLPGGRPAYMQYGKDLTAVSHVVATGGVFAYGHAPEKMLAGALYDESSPLSLRPKHPQFHVDGQYILYAIGLLADVAPTVALRIAKRHLRRVGDGADAVRNQ